MGNKLFVGNISWDATTEDIRALFAEVGNVEDVYLIIDRERNRHKGFGFVTFSTEDEAQAAMDRFNDVEFMGRPLRVTEARPKEENPVQQAA